MRGQPVHTGAGSGHRQLHRTHRATRQQSAGFTLATRGRARSVPLGCSERPTLRSCPGFRRPCITAAKANSRCRDQVSHDATASNPNIRTPLRSDTRGPFHAARKRRRRKAAFTVLSVAQTLGRSSRMRLRLRRRRLRRRSLAPARRGPACAAAEESAGRAALSRQGPSPQRPPWVAGPEDAGAAGPSATRTAR